MCQLIWSTVCTRMLYYVTTPLYWAAFICIKPYQSSLERHLQPAAFRHAIAFTMENLLSMRWLPRRSSSRDSIGIWWLWDLWVHSAKDLRIEANSSATASPIPQWAMSRRSRRTPSERRRKTAPSAIGLISTSRTTSVIPTFVPCVAHRIWKASARSWAPFLEIRLKLRRSCRNVKECCWAMVLVNAWIPWSPKLQCLISRVSLTNCSPQRLLARVLENVELCWYAKQTLKCLKQGIPQMVCAKDSMTSSSTKSSRLNFTEKDCSHFNSSRNPRDTEQRKTTSGASREGRSQGRSKSGTKMPVMQIPPHVSVSQRASARFHSSCHPFLLYAFTLAIVRRLEQWETAE